MRDSNSDQPLIFFLGGGDGFVSRSLLLNFLFQKISNVQNSPKSTIVDIGADSSLFVVSLKLSSYTVVTPASRMLCHRPTMHV